MTTMRHIMIDETGSARAVYTRDDGPSGSVTVELKGTPELEALYAKLNTAIDAKLAETQEERDAARAERLKNTAVSRDR